MPSDTYKGYTVSFNTQNETWSVSALNVHHKTYKQCVAAVDRHTKNMRKNAAVTALRRARRITDDLDEMQVQIVEYLGDEGSLKNTDKVAIMAPSWRNKRPRRMEENLRYLIADTPENRIRLEIAKGMQADGYKLIEEADKTVDECSRVTLKDISELVKISEQEPEEITR